LSVNQNYAVTSLGGSNIAADEDAMELGGMVYQRTEEGDVPEPPDPHNTTRERPQSTDQPCLIVHANNQAIVTQGNSKSGSNQLDDRAGGNVTDAVGADTSAMEGSGADVIDDFDGSVDSHRGLESTATIDPAQIQTPPPSVCMRDLLQNEDWEFAFACYPLNGDVGTGRRA
jgi:hypothetical protein